MESVPEADGACRSSSRGPGQARRDPLHPNAAELYRRHVADLQNALNATDDSCQQAASVLRAMIDRLALAPGQVAVDLHGNLAGVLNLAHDSENGRNPGALLVAVQGVSSESVCPAYFRERGAWRMTILASRYKSTAFKMCQRKCVPMGM